MIDMTIDMQASIPPHHSHFSGNGSCDATREANKREDRMGYGGAQGTRPPAGNGAAQQAQEAQMTPYGGVQAQRAEPYGAQQMTTYGGTQAPYAANGEGYGPSYAWPQTAEEGMNSIPQDSFNEPLNADEAARNSWRALLARNVGRNVLARFLMGTQNFITVEGELYEVGTDYIVIYQPLWDSHITADLYSVKFVEFREPPGQQLG